MPELNKRPRRKPRSTFKLVVADLEKLEIGDSVLMGPFNPKQERSYKSGMSETCRVVTEARERTGNPKLNFHFKTLLMVDELDCVLHNMILLTRSN